MYFFPSRVYMYALSGLAGECQVFRGSGFGVREIAFLIHQPSGYPSFSPRNFPDTIGTAINNSKGDNGRADKLQSAPKPSTNIASQTAEIRTPPPSHLRWEVGLWK